MLGKREIVPATYSGHQMLTPHRGLFWEDPMTMTRRTAPHRSRWAAVGAAIAVTLGGGGLAGVHAADDGDRGDVFTTIDPVRMLDTRGRTKVGAIDGSGAPLRLQVSGTVVPTGASAVQMNVTVAEAQTSAVGGFVTVYPCDIDRPNTSNLNFVNGQTVPNSVTIPLAADGSVCFFVYGRAHLLADVSGYFDDSRLASIEAELGQLRAVAVDNDAASPVEPLDLSDYYRRSETDAAIDAAVTGATTNVAHNADLVGLVDDAEMQMAISDAIDDALAGLDESTTSAPVASFGRTIDTRGRAEHSSAAVWTTAGVTPDVTVGADGLPLIVHHDPGRSRSYLTRCDDVGCTTAKSNAVRTTQTRSGLSVVMSDTGLPIIASTSSADDSRLVISTCDTPSCLSSTSTTVNSGSFSGIQPAMLIGADGLPIVAHLAGGDPAITHCENSTCSASTTTVIDLTDASDAPDIAIGPSGFPILTVSRPDSLGLITCTDAACTATSALRTIAQASIGIATLGLEPALAIGASGTPVIAHRGLLDDGSTMLFVTICADTTCATATTSALANGGLGLDLVIGVDRNPVITHIDPTTGTLHITTCATPSCTSADTDDTGLAASTTAAMIDATGNLATALWVESGATSTIEMHRRTHRSFTPGGWDH